jgi:hypothetical protein
LLLFFCFYIINLRFSPLFAGHADKDVFEVLRKEYPLVTQFHYAKRWEREQHSPWTKFMICAMNFVQRVEPALV